MIMKICPVVIALLALYYDLKTFRIPNKLNLFGCFTGIILSIVTDGARGSLGALEGVLMAFGIMIIFYIVGAIGAGDVKLMCAVGTMLHLRILNVIVISFAVAAVAGACLVIVKLLSGRYIKITRLHMTIPIFCAVLCCAVV